MATKASLQSSKAIQSGFGIQAGCVKVLDARTKIVQRIKKDGTLVTPMLLIQFDVTKCGPDQKPINEEDISQKDFIFCWGSKERDEQGNYKFAFHPGNAKAADDTDPDDLGGEIDTEGNTIVSAGNATNPFADSDAALFMKALEMKGWKPEVNDQCFMGNYIGLVMDVNTVTKAQFCKQVQVKYQTREGASEASDTVWEVTKIWSFPYEQPKGGQKANGKSKDSKSATANAAPAAEVKANGQDQEADPTNLLAIETVKKVSEQKEFKGKEGIARSKFQAAVMTQLHRDKRAKEQGPVMKLVKDDEWIIQTGGDLGFVVDTDEGVMNFISE